MNKCPQPTHTISSMTTARNIPSMGTQRLQDKQLFNEMSMIENMLHKPPTKARVTFSDKPVSCFNNKYQKSVSRDVKPDNNMGDHMTILHKL